MNRSDLMVALAARFPELDEKDAATSVAVILSALKTALSQGHRIEVRRFGSFTLRQMPARSARNPKTGEVVTIPVKRRICFKAGKELRERVSLSTQDQ